MDDVIQTPPTETADQRRERLIEALGHHGSWAKAIVLRRRIADTVITSDRAAGCDPEALRAERDALAAKMAVVTESINLQSRILSSQAALIRALDGEADDA